MIGDNQNGKDKDYRTHNSNYLCRHRSHQSDSQVSRLHQKKKAIA